MGVNLRSDKLEETINTYGIEVDENINWDNEKKIKLLGDYFLSMEPEKYSWATRYVQSLNTVMLCKHLKDELKNFTINPTESDDYIAETKLNGFRCCRAETQLYCGDRTIRTIKEIVDNKLPVSVLSYNEKEDKVEFKKVTGWFNNGLKKHSEWVSLGRIGTRKLKVTKDHKVYTKNRGYIEAQDIRKDDIILLSIQSLNKTQEQLLIGSFLGDGNISTEKRSNLSYGEHRLILVHQEKQKDYLYKKIECLDYFKGKLTEYTSGYGSHCFRHVFKPIKELGTFVENNYEPEVNPRKNFQRRKRLTLPLMEKLDWLGIAVWYMDDGHLLPNKELANVTNRWCRVQIATNKFNEEERKIIKNYFEKYGIHGSYIKSKGETYTFDINSESSQKFFKEVAPYIPESMEYKLPLEYRGKEKVEWWKDNQTVLKSIEITGVDVHTYKVNGKSNSSWECYDIEVEDNHNFFADNALVHNCIVAYSPETGFEMFSRNESTSNFLNGNLTSKYLFINKGLITEPKDYKNAFNYRFILDGEVIVDKQIEGVGNGGVTVEDYIQSILGSNEERAKSFQKEECKLKFTAFDVLYFEKDPKIPAEWTPQYNYYEEEFSPEMVKWVEEHFSEYLRSGNFKQGGTKCKKLYQYLYLLRKTCKYDVRRLPFSKRRELRHKLVDFLQSKNIPVFEVDSEDTFKIAFTEQLLREGKEGSILKCLHAPYISSMRSSRSHRAALKVKQSINSMLSEDMNIVGDFDVFITSANPPKSDRITDMIGALNCSIYIKEEDGTIKEHEIASISGIPHEWKRKLAEIDVNTGKISLNPEYKYKVIPINGLALTKGNLKFQHATLLNKGQLEFKPKNPTDCTWDRSALNEMVITRGE